MVSLEEQAVNRTILDRALRQVDLRDVESSLALARSGRLDLHELLRLNNVLGVAVLRAANVVDDHINADYRPTKKNWIRSTSTPIDGDTMCKVNLYDDGVIESIGMVI